MLRRMNQRPPFKNKQLNLLWKKVVPLRRRLTNKMITQMTERLFCKKLMNNIYDKDPLFARLGSGRWFGGGRLPIPFYAENSVKQ